MVIYNAQQNINNIQNYGYKSDKDEEAKEDDKKEEGNTKDSE